MPKSTNAAVESASPTPRVTKLETIETLLRRERGASLDELVAGTGWQRHSVRGALAGALKKRGHTITSEKLEGVRRYRVAAA